MIVLRKDDSIEKGSVSLHSGALISLSNYLSQTREGFRKGGACSPHVRSCFSLRSCSRIEKGGSHQVLLAFRSTDLIEKLLLMYENQLSKRGAALLM